MRRMAQTSAATRHSAHQARAMRQFAQASASGSVVAACRRASLCHFGALSVV